MKVPHPFEEGQAESVLMRTLLVLPRNVVSLIADTIAESKFIDKNSVLLGTEKLHSQILCSFFTAMGRALSFSFLLDSLSQGDVQLTMGHLD